MPTLARRLTLAALPLALACDRAPRAAPPRSAAARGAAQAVAPRDTNLWRGVYAREGDVTSFRPCGSRILYHVAASDSLLALLDAKVDFQAPRPTTTVFVQLLGDTIRAGRGGQRAGTFAVTAVDSSRALDGEECAPERPVKPPAVPQAVALAAARAALGRDSALARGARAAAVWLNADQRGDLLVLLTAPAACDRRRGCILLALQGTAEGYHLVGRTRAVKTPVTLRAPIQGWRDIAVRVDQGLKPDRVAMLRFGTVKYPDDAALQPDAREPRQPPEVIFP